MRESHLPANASCAVAVTFTPTAIGQRTATVDFADVGNGSPAQVVLTGTGCRGETCSGTVDAPPSDGTTTSPPPSVGGTPPEQQAPTGPPAKQKTTAPTPRQPTVGQAPTEVRNG